MSLRAREPPRDVGDLLLRGRRFDEDHVGAGFEIGRGALEGGLITFDRDRVGARDDDEIRIVQRVLHGVQPLHHLRCRHQRLVVVMAAFLREALVFEVECGDAGALEGAGGALGGERIAVAGSASAMNGTAHRLDHLAEPPFDLVGREQADVGYAGRPRDRAAARIDGVKPACSTSRAERPSNAPGATTMPPPLTRLLSFVVARTTAPISEHDPKIGDACSNTHDGRHPGLGCAKRAHPKPRSNSP